MAIIGKNGKMSTHTGKTSNQGRQALYKRLEPNDKIALEAGNRAFIMAREIQEWVGGEVRVLNSAKLPYVWDTPTKTDKEDAMKPTHLIEERLDEKLPLVPLPDERKIERRKTPAHNGREVRSRTGLLNTLHALCIHQGHTTIVKKNLATVERRREAVAVLRG